jgi:hypothetical protein
MHRHLLTEMFAVSGKEFVNFGTFQALAVDENNSVISHSIQNKLIIGSFFVLNLETS